MNTQENRETKVQIGARIPEETETKIKKIAAAEDRTVSQVISRLLQTHPQIETAPNAQVTTNA